MTNNRYLQNLGKRRFDESLKSNLLFGLTLGWVLTLVGAFRCFILLEQGWIFGLVLGLLLLFLALVLPQSLDKAQQIVKRAGGFAATQLFRVLLAFVYFIVILPVGLIYQASRGRAPFYSWEGEAPASIEGWVAKQSTDEGSSVAGQTRKQSALLQPIYVLGYFASHGELILMPCLILFLVLGVLGIFVQSTGLAPLIYTLF